MSLLQVVIQAQILAEASDKPPGKGKVAGAVQWAMSTLGEDSCVWLHSRLQGVLTGFGLNSPN